MFEIKTSATMVNIIAASNMKNNRRTYQLWLKKKRKRKKKLINLNTKRSFSFVKSNLLFKNVANIFWKGNKLFIDIIKRDYHSKYKDNNKKTKAILLQNTKHLEKQKHSNLNKYLK